MTRFWLVYGAVLIAAGALLFAQDEQGAGKSSPMDKKGMMGMSGKGMMGKEMPGKESAAKPAEAPSALHRLMMTPYALPVLKTQLNLSDEQLAGMERVKDGLKSRNRELADKIAAKKKELDAAAALAKGPAHAQFRELADLKADMQFNVVDAGSTMRAALSETQRAKFAGMSDAEVHKALMSSGKMMEMHEALKVIGEMPMGGMMAGGMKPEDRATPQSQAAPAGEAPANHAGHEGH